MSQTAVRTNTVHIFVETEAHKPPVKLEFETNETTGRQIKERAGVPLENDLARRHGQTLELITNDEPVVLKNGEHFVSLPPGTVS